MNKTCPVCQEDVGKTATEFLFNVQVTICPRCRSELISASDGKVFYWHCWSRKSVPKKEN